MTDLKQYLPSIYSNNIQMHAITNTEESVLDECVAVVQQEKANSFVLTADLDGIKRYEDVLGIVANPNVETLEFRRQRVLNRYSFSPPFTMEYLKEKLDTIIGENRWSSHLDEENYTLYIESSAEDQNWYQEILVTMNRIKPANIVFINTPLITRSLATNEQIEASEYQWNYRLGISWSLGVNAFSTLNGIGVIKMATTRSIQDKLLDNLITTAKNSVAKVRVNDTHLITDFVTLETTGNILTVEYDILTDIGEEVVTSVELLDADSNVLTQASVYIPLIEDVRLKHTILVKEV